MSDRKKKRGRPRQTPVLSYGAELRMRNSIARKIKKPKYLRDQEEVGSNQSRASTPSYDDVGSTSSSKGKNSRGYNPDIDDKNSEFHYGSDFESDTNASEHGSDQSSHISFDGSDQEMEEEEELLLPMNTSFSSLQSAEEIPEAIAGRIINTRPPTPVPVWLQDRNLPELYLPPSSDDLLVPAAFILQTVGIYEVLRHFRNLVRLSPFKIEDFCAALIAEEQSSLLGEIHMALLKSLIREEESQQTHFGPLDQKDSINICLYLIDPLTWPEVLRIYLQSDREFLLTLNVLESCNYPFTTLENRLKVLQFMTDQFLQLSSVRENLLNEGKLRYDDHCRGCQKTGDLLCCDSCSAVYHLDCVEPPMLEVPGEMEDWTCSVCKSHQVSGVTDCILPLESSGMLSRQDPLGYDRHGRKYWFLVRRIFVEAEEGDVWYYSTNTQFDELLRVFDPVDLEDSLWVTINQMEQDIRNHLAITESITDSKKGTRQAYLNQLNDKIKRQIPRVQIPLPVIEGPVIKEENAIPILSIKGSEIVPKKIDTTRVQKDVKERLKWFSSNVEPYRLGCDNTYKTYSNQYATNHLALNKVQHAEERDKKRHLSHKFSLAIDYKWNGGINGSKEVLFQTVKNSLVNLEQAVSSYLYHPHWAQVRKNWVSKVHTAKDPMVVARCMMILLSAIKGVMFTSVWHDSLGHTRLKRLTAFEREERKKAEKKDKKEEEEYRPVSYVKYTKRLKHQLWKQKGEEYRIHRLWGWQWLSNQRKYITKDMHNVGLRAGPETVACPIKTANGIKSILLKPVTFKQLAEKLPALKTNILNCEHREPYTDTKTKHEIIIQTPEGQKSVQVALFNYETLLQRGVVNVSQALTSKTRLLYNRMTSGSPFLDGLLAKRVALKKIEDKDKKPGSPDLKNEVDDDVDIENSDTDSTLSDNSEQLDLDDLPDKEKLILNKKSPIASMLKDIDLHKSKYEKVDAIDVHHRCYSTSCRAGGRNSCYSPLCIAKVKAMQKLTAGIDSYKIVSGKKSPYDHIGVKSPIKLEVKDEVDVTIDTNKNSINGTSSTDVNEVKAETVDDGDSKSTTGSEIKIKVEDELDENSCQSSASYESKFSSTESCNTSGKFFLKNVQEKDKERVPRKKLRLPQLASFAIGKQKFKQSSIFIIPKWEQKIIARRGGKYSVQGFNHNSKPNPLAWPYPCGRPSFKLSWLYRTSYLSSQSTAALQFRVLHSCMKWEDMSEKGPPDGKKHITTDMEIIQTEILKRKYSGRFLEKVQYLLRVVTIPLDVPKPTREFTPSQRSGLRKRRRAQSPEQKQPESREQWVDEEKLLVWEVKSFGDRLEKAALAKKVAPVIDKTEVVQSTARSSSPAEIKAKMEEQLRIQRATFAFKKSLETGTTTTAKGGVVKLALGSTVGQTPGKVTLTPGAKVVQAGTSSIMSVSGANVPFGAKKIVTTRDGRFITVQSAGTPTGGNEGKINMGSSTIFPVGGVSKVQLTSPGGNKVIRLQARPATPGQRMILPRAATPGNNLVQVTPRGIRPQTQIQMQAIPQGPQVASNKQPPQIKVTKLPNGQMQVTGLKEGQTLLQRADGKYQIISTNVMQQAQTPTPVANNIETVKVPSTPTGPQIVKVNGQQVLLRPAPQDKSQVVKVGASEAVASMGANTGIPNSSTPLIQPTPRIKTMLAPDGTMVKTVVSPNKTNVSTPTNVYHQNNVNTSNNVVTQPNNVVNTTPQTVTNSLTLKVQVRMSDQGPKTIIQGLLPGVGLTRDHILAIQQQVRNMLQQYKLEINQLSPVMTLTLQVASKNPSQNSPVKQITPSPQLNNQTNTALTPIKPPQQLLAKVDNTSISPTKQQPHLLQQKENIPASEANTKILPQPNANLPDGSENPDNKFVLTPEYIQQTIQSALKKSDLAPDVEEKLQQLQKYNIEQSDTPVNITKPSLKRPIEDDNESDMPNLDEPVAAPVIQTSKSRPKKQKVDIKTSSSSDVCTSKSKKSTTKSELMDAKKRQAVLNKLDSMLTRHKELLKKDILKKRAHLEKELQLNIHKELSTAKHQLNLLEKSKTPATQTSPKKKKPESNQTIPSHNTKSVMDNISNANDQKTKNKSNAKNSSNKKSKSKSKKKICICRTPFDDTKFYVGCDLCGNWFHGDCVGISEALSRHMTEYVCDDCANAKLNKELFCFCRQPYDETQFYICCEQCEDWYHGKCIGIMQPEADDIDDYICPKCDPNNIWNFPCQKKLTAKDYIELKKVAKGLIQQKNAWPFLEPVDPNEVPDYYKVVKEPMDLKSVEQRVDNQQYSHLAQFIGDVMLVFDNCRLYNPPNSSFCSCAATLEHFFCAKVKHLKQKISQSR